MVNYQHLLLTEDNPDSKSTCQGLTHHLPLVKGWIWIFCSVMLFCFNLKSFKDLMKSGISCVTFDHFILTMSVFVSVCLSAITRFSFSKRFSWFHYLFFLSSTDRIVPFSNIFLIKIFCFFSHPWTKYLSFPEIFLPFLLGFSSPALTKYFPSPNIFLLQIFSSFSFSDILLLMTKKIKILGTSSRIRIYI